MLYYILLYIFSHRHRQWPQSPQPTNSPYRTLRVSLCRSETISFSSNYIPGLGKQMLACSWGGWYCQQPSGNCCYWRILLAVRRPSGQWILAVRKCRLGEVSCQLLTHDAASWVADDTNTTLLDFAAFSLSHRLDAGVGSPADAVDDGCEALVLTAASRQWHVAAGSEGGEQ